MEAKGVWSARERRMAISLAYGHANGGRVRRLSREEIERDYGTLDGAIKPAIEALNDVRRIGNERAGIHTDCRHCVTHLRARVMLEPRESKKIFRCSKCGQRWTRRGAEIVAYTAAAESLSPASARPSTPTSAASSSSENDPPGLSTPTKSA